MIHAVLSGKRRRVAALVATAGSLALAMVVVMIVLMSVYGALQRRAARWGER